jgi:hypothetical protein
MEIMQAAVGNLANKPQQSDSESRPDTSEHKKRMLGLWIRLAEGWGHKFVSSAGDRPNETWTNSLADLSHEKFRKGLDRLAKSTDAWPPSLGEFRGWCVEVMTEKQARAKAELEWESQPDPPYNPFNAGPTYQQIEQDRRRYVSVRVAQLTMPDRPDGVAFDPRRICLDEELR